MPLQSIRKINADTVLGLWHLEEPAEALQQQLQALAPAALLFPSFSHPSRQQQWLGGRLLAYTLLQQLTTARPLLVAAPGEKPYFKQAGLHLSISHTRSQVAAILSRCAPVGIDKFLTPAEQALAGQDLNKTLIYWCAKETLYKLHGRRQVLFKEHLQVGPIGSQPLGQLPAGIYTPEFAQDYLVHYEVGTDFILTYCLAPPA
jgi:4'-phosphopantetheinyl transferase